MLENGIEALHYCDDIALQGAVWKPQSSDYLLLYQTQLYNPTPEKTRVLQPPLYVRLLMYFQKNHGFLLFSFCKGSYDRT